MSAGELNVAAELASLRGAMDTGFAKLEGRLDVIAASQSHTDRELNELDDRVSALESRRIPLAPLAAVSGAVSAVVAAGALFLK